MIIFETLPEPCIDAQFVPLNPNTYHTLEGVNIGENRWEQPVLIAEGHEGIFGSVYIKGEQEDIALVARTAETMRRMLCGKCGHLLGRECGGIIIDPDKTGITADGRFVVGYSQSQPNIEPPENNN